MKRGSFKPKLPDPQAQLKSEHAEAKKRMRAIQGGFKGSSHPQGKICYEDGIQFKSKWERHCYRFLKYRQNAGEIKDLKCHQIFPILVLNGNSQILRYTIDLDFTFFDLTINRPCRCDAKPDKKRANSRIYKHWMLRYELLRHVDPDFHYEIFYMPVGWREKENWQHDLHEMFRKVRA